MISSSSAAPSTGCSQAGGSTRKPLFLLTFLPPLVYLRIERRLADSEFFRQLVAPTVVVDAIQ